MMKVKAQCQKYCLFLDLHLPLSIDNDQRWWRGISTEWEDSGVSTRESHQAATEPCANKSHTARSNPSSIAICKPAAPRLPLQQVQFTRAWEQPLWPGKRWLTRRFETNTASLIRQLLHNLPRFFQFVHSKWQDRAHRTAEWLLSQVFVLSFFNFTVDQ